MKPLRNDLTKYIEKFVFSYAVKHHALDCQFGPNKSIHFSLLKFENYQIELVYSFKNMRSFPKSCLFMRIYRSSDDPSFELGELLTYMGKKELRCTWYPFISTEKMMGLALSSLFSIYEDYRDEIDEVFGKYTKYRELEEGYAKEIRRIFKIKPSSPDMKLTTHELCLKYNQVFEIGICGLVFAYNNYHFSFLSGDFKKARKFYQKKHDNKRALMHEENIWEAINNPDLLSGVSLINEEYLKDYKAFKKENNNNRVGLKILLNSLLVFVVLLFIYVAVAMEVEEVLSKDTILFYGEIIDDAVISAGLPMIFGGIALRNIITRIFHRKRAKEIISQDRMINGKFLDWFSSIVFIITLMASILFNIFTYTQTERFYDEKMILHGNHMFEYEEHLYSDSAKLYLRKGIINPYGDYVERDSYLLVFKDGTYYDFDGEIECEEFLNSVYPLIRDYVGEIETIKCKEDIGLE